MYNVYFNEIGWIGGICMALCAIAEVIHCCLLTTWIWDNFLKQYVCLLRHHQVSRHVLLSLIAQHHG